MGAALLLCLWAPLAALRPQAPAAAEQADRPAVLAYRAGELESARGLWLELLEAEPPAVAGRERARVLYNLGNVAARAERWLEAVGWYTAALRLRPRDGDTWANLEHARLQAGLEAADRGDLLATLRRLLSSATRAESERLALLALVPLALALLGEALLGGAAWRRLAAGALALFLIGAAPWIYHLAPQARDPLLVVEENGAPVRSEPRRDAAAVARAAAGSQVERIDALPEWVKVELEDGTAGWMRAESAFRLVR